MATAMVSDRTSLVVAICTYKRNEDLAVLLRALIVCADCVKHRAVLGVVVVDDTATGDARAVAEKFADKFELGLEYRISGKQNISLARNLAVETAIEMADWTAMTDDDCEPPSEWIAALLDVQAITGSDAITGRMVRRAPPGSPRWLYEEPFFELGVEQSDDCAEVETGATFNSMIRSAWLKEHADIRFDPAFGVIGGEDMVFFRAARVAGLRVRFATDAFVYENESVARATLRYQLYAHYWQGNSSYHSLVKSGVPRWRAVVHGGASLMRAIFRPLRRIVAGHSPQLRYGVALILHAVGQLVGFVGVRVKHH